MKIYPFAVIPSPGMYGNGQIRAESRHRTREAARREAIRRTNKFRKAMAEHGGSSGGYQAVVWDREGKYFWADMPPASLAAGRGFTTTRAT